MNYAKKRWGQNFLIDQNIARKIVRVGTENEPDHVIEIGPGKGVLTRFLAEMGIPYTGIEIDPSLAQLVSRAYDSQQAMQILQEDFLAWDIEQFLAEGSHNSIAVIGNVPYNITSPILFKLFDYHNMLQCATLMVQKEVAERMRASAGSKAYGILAIFCQLYADTKYCFTVPSHLFKPRPAVDSAVVKLTFSNKLTTKLTDIELFRRIVRGTFQKRRKMLRNSLSAVLTEHILQKLQVDLTRRPEQLVVEEWISLTENVHQLMQEEPSL